ncbi:MAG: Ni/Fe hydrogenase subunit alpha [Gaiellaceae bacterium]
MSRTRTIKTDFLARVEGEGAMHLRIRDGRVDDVRLRIYEPPRFFEALLRGRGYCEPPDITARICGICPIAYQMSACAAIEDACGVQVDEPIRLLRRLIYCGEWIESHTLHVFMLHAPDVLGYDGAVAMARDHRGIVERGLQIKKAGNAIITAVGGREIHPVNVRVGGFYRAPRPRELRALVEPLERARELALETVAWTGGLSLLDFESDYEFVALSDAHDYPLERGRLASSSGLDIAPGEYEEHFVEEHVPHSTALHSRLRDGGAYLCGPLARYSLNSARLSPLAREAAAEAGLGPVCNNPFRSIVVRSVEILYALDEALRLIATYEEPERPAVEVPPRAGAGCGWTEAPRGMLWHRYRIDEDGTIAEAKIVPPTSQNQATIEADLRAFLADHLDLEDDPLRVLCEQAIRNHDPCISCATHFLDLEVERV